MRPQQQNRRMRSRNGGGGNNNSNNNNTNNSNNNNRRGPNPLTRNYESNGPDVKIRGSAQQIAEKYSTLARDAQSSGDRVMAENYLQHAEHYNRIIAAAQAQFASQQIQAPHDDLDDELDDDGYGFEGNVGGQADQQVQHSNQQSQHNQQPQPVFNGSGPQPVIEGMPAEVALNQVSSQPGNQGGGRNRDRQFRNRNNGNQQPASGPAAASVEPRNGSSSDASIAEQIVAQPADSVGESATTVSTANLDGQPAAESADGFQPRRGRRPRRNTRETRDSDGPTADGEAASNAGEPVALAAVDE